MCGVPGVQAEAGASHSGAQRAQVSHPEPARPLAPAQRHRRTGATAFGWRSLLH